MVFCTYCGQSFTRDEHLERHILTHTNIKPYKCGTCHMAFARRDLLQRHYTVHGKNQDGQDGVPSILIPKHSGRTPIACTNCAKTKTKCDKKFPCSRCSSRNLKCILRPNRRQSRTIQKVSTKPDNDNNIIATTETSQPTQVATPDRSSSSSASPPPQLPLPTQPIHSMQSPPIPATLKSGGSFTNNTNAHVKNPSRQSTALFHPSPSNSSQQIIQTVLSPLPTPGTIIDGYLSRTPMSGFDDFAGVSRNGSDQSSPQWMDWTQLGFPTSNMDAIVPQDMLIQALPLTMDNMGDPSMIPIIPDYVHPFHTPLQTRGSSVSNSLPELDMANPSVGIAPSTRQTSISYETTPSDLAAVIKGQEGWNCFRSAPTLPPSAVPKTARSHIERLEQSLKNHEGWHHWGPAWTDIDTSNDYLCVVPLHESAKDKLLAITQSFLHKALETHRHCSTGTPEGGQSPASYGSNFVLLPPIRVLTYFMRAYANTFERFFPMSSRGTLDINQKLMSMQTCDKAASLLTLMIIAAGALSIPSMDARWINGGLVEACRISLFDLIETNISMASDTTVLHSALLFTTTAAWSGDKWHMNMAMGQRGMYTAMLRHSGALESQSTILLQGSTEDLHSHWLSKESLSRLVYSWAMLDQDCSLFNDSAPLFSITEFGAPMPDSDRLWHAKTAAEWSTVFSQVHEFSGGYSAVTTGVRPMSLRDMFRHFMEDNIIPRGLELTPLHLRLLLHPLQSLVYQYRQLTSCFSDNISPRQQVNNLHTQSVRARAEEIQILLKRWHRLSDRYLSSHPICPMMQASLVMFHLISLNAVTNFPEIEKLARKEDFDGSVAQLVWKHKKCISDVEEAIFNCGQIIRVLKNMPSSIRPPWWAGAVYRVALVLWTDCLMRNEDMSQNGSFTSLENHLAVDALEADNSVLTRYRSKKEGKPALTRRDGSIVTIDNGFAVVSFCMEVLDEGVANRFSDGIRNKLEVLARGG